MVGCSPAHGESASTRAAAGALAEGCAAIPIASIAASSVQGPNVAANAADGDPGTGWLGAGADAYVTADLGAPATLCGVDIAWYRGGGRKWSFTIAVSTDGVGYSTVYSGAGGGASTSYEPYAFPQVSARYVRVTMNGGAGAGITDLRVGGTQSDTQSGAPAAAPDHPATVLFSEPFDYPDGLIINEYAMWNANHADARHSPIWEMTSGSLFAKDGTGWSGVPDGTSPDADSSPYNDSSVFRLTTKDAGFGDVAVSFSLKNNYLVTTSRTPAVDWDGIDFFLRYQSEYWLYIATINRRDDTAVIKKKLPGGPINGGNYYVIGSPVPHVVHYGVWQHVKATIETNANGSVTIALYDGPDLVVSGTDDGVGGPPITSPGKVGIRGDNADFQIDDFVVTKL